MMEGAELFEGTHDFTVYTASLKPNTKTVRKIESCSIVENDILTANFFPEHSEDIKASLLAGSELKLNTIAPGSGLMLNQLHFNK